MSDKKQQEIVKAYLQGKISEQKMLRELDKLDGKKTAKNKYFNEKVEIDG
ncbi:MAG TPA: ChaN family lipoprotein, partial [Clostridiaceae bacterium]|nr:ChaN family lipoprotein [Clostridiaceae bacterium]